MHASHTAESERNMLAVHASLQELNVKYNSVVTENQKLQRELDDEKGALKKNMETVFKSLEELLYGFQLKQDQLRDSQVTENRETNQKLREIEKKQQVTESKVGALKKGIQAQKLEMQLLACYPGFPVDYYVKRNDELVYLPAFYTDTHGDRMCVRVYSNGYGGGEGTHVSIFTYMMQSPFDKYLKWPFRGEITIQMVNQVGDHDHVEKTIHYTDRTPDDTAGRVTGLERAEGWGFHQFIAHNELQYNAARQTQYLKDNTLHIRVMKVTLY